MGWRNLSDTSEVITTLLEESMKGAANAVQRTPLPVGFSLGAPTVRCTNCPTAVRAEMICPPVTQPGQGRWVFPVDDRGWCADCLFMEGVDTAISENGHWSPR